MAERLPLSQQSQAFRHISLVLPSEHPEKLSFAERALSVLEPTERNAETITRQVQAAATLLPLVDKERQAGLIQILVSGERELHSVSEALPRPSWSPIIESIAEVDFEKAKALVFKRERLVSGWTDTWPVVVKRMALVNYQDALNTATSQFSHYVWYPSVLVEIIRIVAVQWGNVGEAERLIQRYSETLSRSREMPEAQLALAEAYLIQGDRRKAEEIFDSQVFVINDEGVKQGRSDLLCAMLARSCALDSYDVEVVFDHLGDVEDGHYDSIRRLMGYMAVCQDKIDFIEAHRLGLKAQIGATYEAATHDPGLARELCAKWNLCRRVTEREARHLDTYIAVMEAQKDILKIEEFLRCYDVPHDMCNKMVALPEALGQLMKEHRISSDGARSIIERVYPLLVNWKCTQGKDTCECFARSERALVHLIGLMAQLDRERAEQILESLPQQPVKVRALLWTLAYTQPDETLIERIIQSIQEVFSELLDLAGSYYDVAANVLPAEGKNWIVRLIQLADPLLDDRARPSPSQSLRINRAKAHMKLVDGPDQFRRIEDVIDTVPNFLDANLKFFDVLTNRATNWSAEDKQRLLWEMWRLSTTRGITDVEALIASAIPAIESLVEGNEKVKSFWKLYDQVEWAYQELPKL